MSTPCGQIISGMQPNRFWAWGILFLGGNMIDQKELATSLLLKELFSKNGEDTQVLNISDKKEHYQDYIHLNSKGQYYLYRELLPEIVNF